MSTPSTQNPPGIADDDTATYWFQTTDKQLMNYDKATAQVSRFATAEPAGDWPVLAIDATALCWVGDCGVVKLAK